MKKLYNRNKELEEFHKKEIASINIEKTENVMDEDSLKLI